MKPWREVAIPHRDVLEGTFQQSEFAADITAVQTGKAPREYQDAQAFFDRTYITEGMRLLLTQVAQRLSNKGGEPVIQLQTAFGGGKTHTMLAVYHMATRSCPLSDLAGIPTLVEKAGLMDVPQARVVVLDGTAHAPNQSRRYGNQEVKTLWGELAWQLGGSEAFARLKDADASGTSPGKEILRDLLARHAPCVILIDELLAYVRQFPEGKQLSGGSFDSNLSFIQALTEAVKLVPTAILLASLPESEVEAGSQRSGATLLALEKTFGRIQALWKPVDTEEAFEIVRRRLFEPTLDLVSRNAVCRAFADAYITEGAKLPTDTQEGRYYDRLLQAYPIHPEIFDRLYEDWTTIDGFQRTRGVLKLMAKVIYRLWQDDNKDLMILPGSLPLYDGNTRNELTYHLPAGWDAVIEGDIDGSRAETTELEKRETRFGQISAARRVARTLFLGSAPSSVANKAGIRGLDRARILLGSLQPGQASSTYTDALNRLADLLHYLNTSGDKAQDATRFWFDTRANLRREMEDRKQRFNEKAEVRDKIAEAIKSVLSSGSFFEGIHIFTPHADVPDNTALRLVVLPPETWYAREEEFTAFNAVQDFIRKNGTKPRYRSNRLLFLAADHAVLSRLREAVRIVLAWQSIVDDVKEGRLNIDLLQKKQADKELQNAQDALPRIVRECYRWLLCPAQETPTDAKTTIEAAALATGSSTMRNEIERVCTDNEWVITAWSPVHLRTNLKQFYWKNGTMAANAMIFWEDTLRYLYLPRLQNLSVLEKAIRSGAATRDFFGTAYNQNGDQFEGFQLGNPDAQLNDTLLLIEPEAAKQYEASQKPPDPNPVPVVVLPPNDGGNVVTPPPTNPTPGDPPITPPPPPPLAKARSFHGTAEITAATAKTRLIELADEIIAVLTGDPNATVKVTVELEAEYPNGVSDHIKRVVSENATQLGLKTAEWE